jgi:hypothetical protein
MNFAAKSTGAESAKAASDTDRALSRWKVG